MAVKEIYKRIFGNLYKDEVLEENMIRIYSSILDEELDQYLNYPEKKAFLNIINQLISDSQKHQEMVKGLLNKYVQK